MNNLHSSNGLSDSALNAAFLTEFAKFSDAIIPSHQGTLVSALVTANPENKQSKKKNKQEQPKDKPKRPLSSYNLFFKDERGKILRETPERPGGKPRRSHGKIGFADLARSIAANWKAIEPESRAHFDALAAKDKERYRTEMDVWKKKQEVLKQAAELNKQSQQEQQSACFEPLGVVSPDMSMHGMNTMAFSDSQMYGMGVGLSSMVDDEKLYEATSPVPIVSLASQAFRQPSQRFSFAYRPPPLSDLAHELDDECQQLLKAIFRH